MSRNIFQQLDNFLASDGVETGIVILSLVVTARMGLQRSEKCHKGIERCERRRN